MSILDAIFLKKKLGYACNDFSSGKAEMLSYFLCVFDVHMSL